MEIKRKEIDLHKGIFGGLHLFWGGKRGQSKKKKKEKEKEE